MPKLYFLLTIFQRFISVCELCRCMLREYLNQIQTKTILKIFVTEKHIFYQNNAQFYTIGSSAPLALSTQFNTAGVTTFFHV